MKIIVNETDSDGFRNIRFRRASHPNRRRDQSLYTVTSDAAVARGTNTYCRWVTCYWRTTAPGRNVRTCPLAPSRVLCRRRRARHWFSKWRCRCILRTAGKGTVKCGPPLLSLSSERGRRARPRQFSWTFVIIPFRLFSSAASYGDHRTICRDRCGRNDRWRNILFPRPSTPSVSRLFHVISFRPFLKLFDRSWMLLIIRGQIIFFIEGDPDNEMDEMAGFNAMVHRAHPCMHLCFSIQSGVYY